MLFVITVYNLQPGQIFGFFKYIYIRTNNISFSEKYEFHDQFGQLKNESKTTEL